jgi:hypothetical protein
MRRAIGISFVLSNFIACSIVRATCDARPAGVSEATAAAGDRREVVTDASVDTKAEGAPRATRDAPALCELIAERLHLVAAWRDRPGSMIGREAMSCDLGTSPQVCSKTNVDDDGFIGAGFFESGPGAFFHFRLEEGVGGVPMTRLTCQTLGLAAASQPDPGVERCEMVKSGALAGMTIITDSRCDRLRITAFDDAFRARSHDAAKVDPCETPSPGRLAAQPMLCGTLAR